MPESLFIIDLSYKVPLEKLDEAMKAHINFLDKHYESGHFIASGRKVPRTGGIILAKAESKAEVEGWMKADPFYKLELTDFTVTEFLTSKAHPLLKELLESANI